MRKQNGHPFSMWGAQQATVDLYTSPIVSEFLSNLHEIPQEIACVETDFPLGIAKEPHVTELSYRQLENFSNLLAVELLNRHVKPGDRIGVYLSSSKNSYIAALAIFKVGAVFVPLETSKDASARVTGKIKTSDAHYIIGSNQAPADFDPDKFIDIDVIDNPDAAENYLFKYSHTLADDAPLYIEFTSGSTGQPKAVILPCAAAAVLIKAAQDFKFKPVQDIRPGVLMKAPLTFDASWEELIKALTLRAKACFIAAPYANDPIAVTRIINMHGITHATFLANFLAQLDPTKCTSLLDVISMGAPPTDGLLLKWLMTRAGIVMRNETGMTEAGVRNSEHRITRQSIYSFVASYLKDAVQPGIEDSIEDLTRQVQISFEDKFAYVDLSQPLTPQLVDLLLKSLSIAPAQRTALQDELIQALNSLLTQTIGRAIPGTELLVLKADGDKLLPCADGDTGELCVLSPGLGQYLDDAERNKKAFPFCKRADNGSIIITTQDQAEFRLYRSGDLAAVCTRSRAIKLLGREDGMKKRHGVRFEIQAICSEITNLASVADAHVLVLPIHNDYEIIACVVARNPEAPPTLTSIKAALIKSGLTLSVLPTYLLILNKLPKTGSEKVDPNELKKLYFEQITRDKDAVKAMNAPTTSLKIMKDLKMWVIEFLHSPLPSEHVSIQEALKPDSFSWMQFTSKIIGRYRVTLSPDFSNYSLKQLAEHIESSMHSPRSGARADSFGYLISHKKLRRHSPKLDAIHPSSAFNPTPGAI